MNENPLVSVSLSKANWEAIIKIITKQCKIYGPEWVKWGDEINKVIQTSLEQAGLLANERKSKAATVADDDHFPEDFDPSERIQGYSRDDPDLYIEFGPHPEDY
jgi:hypothetical protein